MIDKFVVDKRWTYGQDGHMDLSSSMMAVEFHVCLSVGVTKCFSVSSSASASAGGITITKCSTLMNTEYLVSNCAYL